MPPLRFFLLALALHLLPALTTAQDGSGSFSDKAKHLVEERLEQKAFVGAVVGFSVLDDTTWTHGAGLADREAGIAFASSTRMRVASIAKPMTAIAIMQLVEQGKIDPDTSVQIYVPDFPLKPEGTITVRQLLQHSAGVDDYGSDKERENQVHYATVTDAMGIFKDRKLVAEPGSSFHYTTYGYVLLGVVIERVSGMTYAEYMHKNIWSVAGMNATGTEGPDATVPLPHAALYHANGKGRITPAKPTDLSDRVPGGGVYSTLDDLLKFGDALLDGRLVKASTLAEMLKDPGLKREGNGYGLGWYLFGENPKYGPVFGHNGAQTGASTFLMILPEQRTTIAVLANTSGAMRAVTDITIGMFDIAAEARKAD